MKTNPTQLSERIISIDVLRGFALLGLLPINIQVFSMIGIAYMNPLVYGNFEGINKLIWMLGHLLFDLKFLSIFSILFGAGIVLFTERLKAKGIISLSFHYRRAVWLTLIGFAHAYLLWGGDILVTYAACGMLVVLLRNFSPKKLFIIGLIVFSIASLIYLIIGITLPYLEEKEIQQLMQKWSPGADLINEEIASLQGSWAEQMGHRVDHANTLHTFFFLYTGWRAGGLMLIGMALYKWGIITAQKSKRFYIKLTSICLIAGFSIVGYGLKTIINSNFEMVYSFFFGSQYNYWGSLLICFGYIGLVMLCVKANILKHLKISLQAVGQMALTNYLMQTIMCTTIFYGHGFGLFGKVERWEQIIIVCGILLFQMITSPIWLRYFKYGPFEWLWRSLTYWRFQQMKR